MKRKNSDLFSRGAVVAKAWSGMFLLLVLLLLPSSIMAATVEEMKNDETPAMVQRHLFSPEGETPAEKAQGPRSEAATKLEKELLFTGVIHSPRGKWAIVRPRNKRKREDAPWRLSEGDEIKGYHIEEIGSNYIVLTRNDKPVRLNLYRGSKKRPAAAAEPPPPLKPVPAAAANPKQAREAKGATPGARPDANKGANAHLIRRRDSKPAAAAPSPKENAKNTATRQPSNSLADILKRARGNKQTGDLPPTNPFSRIIQQSRDK
ncbi:MAG: hypothetical protein U9P37_09545 [Pseudomonadota bacterium]|nr:hypothetical protein [Pseudomonadota bacterium]